MDEVASLAGPTRAEDSPVAVRLQALARTVPPTEIGELWVFPPLEALEGSAEFFLFTRRVGEERRGLYSARLEGENGSGERQVVVEHGSVPADRVPRLVDRLQRRLGEGFRPYHAVIDGSTVRWEELLHTHRNGGSREAVRRANGGPAGRAAD
ncbi:MAG: hypothetical protein ACE5HP_01810 [Gemmatimonadota bacterium]